MSTTEPSVAQTVSPGQAGLVNWVKRHPLVSYFILAFAGAWVFIAPILLSQRAWGVLTLPEPLLLILFLLSTFMGPMPAAFIVTGITEGKAGVKQLLRRMGQWRVGIGWYLLVIIGYPVVFLGGLVLALGPDPLTTMIQNWPLLFTAYLPLIPFGMVYPGLGEEPGWRGFALPRLQGMYGPLVASLVLGAIHAVWHLPVYFIPGAIADGGFDPVSSWRTRWRSWPPPLSGPGCSIAGRAASCLRCSSMPRAMPRRCSCPNSSTPTAPMRSSPSS